MSCSVALRFDVFALSQCSSCCDLRSRPYIDRRQRFLRSNLNTCKFSSVKLGILNRPEISCRASETETEPESNNDKDNEGHEAGEATSSTEASIQNLEQLASQTTAQDQDKAQTVEINALESNNLGTSNDGETKAPDGMEDGDNLEVASGSPLPGVKLFIHFSFQPQYPEQPQQLDESIRISKQTIDILKDQVFGFDTFFVTSHEPYEGGVLFRGNLRGKAAKSYEKITDRIQEKFGDEYKLFLLINPEDDKPVAVVVPRKTLQPERTAVPEWFAAGAFGLVTIFTLLLRNVPALQSNMVSTFDNLGLLMDGLPGALVTAIILGTHEVSHILVAGSSGIKLGVPYFIPSWQIGSFGAITRILSIVPKREDLLKVAAAGPLAGFTLGLTLLLLGFILPPADGLGLVVDASVFHESLLAGGIAKFLLGDALKEGTPISVNPLVIWAWAGLLINAINSIPAGELDGGRIAFALWGRKASSRLSGASIGLLGLASLFNDVAFYWVVLIFILQRGPIAPLSEEITDPEEKYVALGIVVLFLGLLVCLPYPFPFSEVTATGF
ncbi:hypothetical protein RJ641_035922 [Dillenia turbinata]|uniref:Peptidase M50 domain-containing protein n=1 Tax=Dillenia turbinata TaxID=194707 RepID=A0AAN8VS98_9MAGN